MSVWIREAQAQWEVFRATLQDRQVSKSFNEDPGWGGLDAFSPAWRMLGQDAILQPPMPSIVPSTRILERAAERDTNPRPRADRTTMIIRWRHVSAAVAWGG